MGIKKRVVIVKVSDQPPTWLEIPKTGSSEEAIRKFRERFKVKASAWQLYVKRRT